jgi:hypothetical protein
VALVALATLPLDGIQALDALLSLFNRLGVSAADVLTFLRLNLWTFAWAAGAAVLAGVLVYVRHTGIWLDLLAPLADFRLSPLAPCAVEGEAYSHLIQDQLPLLDMTDEELMDKAGLYPWEVRRIRKRPQVVPRQDVVDGLRRAAMVSAQWPITDMTPSKRAAALKAVERERRKALRRQSC